MVVKFIYFSFIFFLASTVYGAERYTKKIIFYMTVDELEKYDSWDFDSKGNLWFLDSKHGQINIIDSSKKIIHSITVPTQDPLQFTNLPNDEAQENNAHNFHIKVDECNNFIIFTDAFNTKIIEIDYSGKIIKQDTLRTGRFDDVSFLNGKIYSKPDNIEVLELSHSNCDINIKNKQWNNFVVLKRNDFTAYGVSLPGTSQKIDLDGLKKKGSYLKTKNIIRDVKGNVYIAVDNMFFLSDPEVLGESYRVTSDTYKYDKNLNLLCTIPSDVEKINIDNETLYSVERKKNGRSFIFEMWVKNENTIR